MIAVKLLAKPKASATTVVSGYSGTTSTRDANRAALADEANHALSADEASHALRADTAVHSESAAALDVDSLTRQEFDSKYIRKDIDDATSHSLGVGSLKSEGAIEGKSLEIDEDASIGGNASVGGMMTAATADVKQGIKGGSFTTQNYVGGLIGGAGAKIDENGNIEAQSAVIRQFLEVPLLKYNRTEVYVGNQWRAPGGGIVKDVQRLSATSGHVDLKLEDGEIGHVAVGDFCMAIYHNLNGGNATADSDDGVGNFAFAGFTTTYFFINSVDDDNSGFYYSLREGYTMHPCASMTFVCYGNSRNEARRSSRYSTLTYERYLRDVDDWTWEGKNIAAQFGDLDNLADLLGISPSGYSVYIDSVYFSGKLAQLDEAVKEAMKNAGYFVDMTKYADEILIDGGHAQLSDENGYQIHTAITCRKGESRILRRVDANPKEGEFCIHVQPYGCTAIEEASSVYVTEVDGTIDTYDKWNLLQGAYKYPTEEDALVKTLAKMDGYFNTGLWAEVEAGKNYMFSFHTDGVMGTHKTDGTNDPNAITAWFYTYNEVNNTAMAGGTYVTAQGFYSTCRTLIDHGNGYYSIPWTCPAGAKAIHVRMNLYSDGTTPVTHKFWGFMLNEGTDVVPFAPEAADLLPSFDAQLAEEAKSLSSVHVDILIDCEGVTTIQKGMTIGLRHNGADGKDGQRGPVLRGPQDWENLPAAYQFEAGKDNEQFYDVVRFGSKYYACKQGHTKSTANPAADTAHWEEFSTIDFVATKILLSDYSLIKNLGAEAIEMKDAEGNVVFYAKDGQVRALSGYFEHVTVNGNLQTRSMRYMAATPYDGATSSSQEVGGETIQTDHWNIGMYGSEMDGAAIIGAQTAKHYILPDLEDGEIRDIQIVGDPTMGASGTFTIFLHSRHPFPNNIDHDTSLNADSKSFLCDESELVVRSILPDGGMYSPTESGDTRLNAWEVRLAKNLVCHLIGVRVGASTYWTFQNQGPAAPSPDADGFSITRFSTSSDTDAWVTACNTWAAQNGAMTESNNPWNG